MGNENSTPKKSETRKFRGDDKSADGDSTTTPEQKRPRKQKAKSSGPTNPFLIFFLRMRSKKPNEHVTKIARAAGRQWAKMTPDQRQKYVNLANAAKKKRGYKKKKWEDDRE